MSVGMSMGMSAGLPFAPHIPWLAPLAGFTDLAFRLLCREYGAGVACTEMVSAKGLFHNSAATRELLRTVPEDAPLVVQLFGREADVLERAVDALRPEYAWFDLNMGCSVPKVVKTGAGAAMLRDPENAVAVVKAMARAAGPGRVGCKIRLGYAARDAVYLDLAQALEDAGAGWITLHPRTAAMGFSGRADWSCLTALVSRVSVPVLASGDLLCAQDGWDCLCRTGARAVMFARGALHDPAVFRAFRELGCGRSAAAPDADAVIRMIRRHMALARRYTPERAALLKMRTFVPRYVRHLPGVRELRQRLARCNSWADLEEILTGFLCRSQENAAPAD